jgi:hypothetical protein
MAVAENLKIKEKTAESYLNKFINSDLLIRKEHNHYEKIGS